jgi:hypothetical protein
MTAAISPMIMLLTVNGNEGDFTSIDPSKIESATIRLPSETDSAGSHLTLFGPREIPRANSISDINSLSLRGESTQRMLVHMRADPDFLEIQGTVTTFIRIPAIFFANFNAVNQLLKIVLQSGMQYTFEEIGYPDWLARLNIRFHDNYKIISALKKELEELTFSYNREGRILPLTTGRWVFQQREARYISSSCRCGELTVEIPTKRPRKLVVSYTDPNATLIFQVREYIDAVPLANVQPFDSKASVVTHIKERVHLLLKDNGLLLY